MNGTARDAIDINIEQPSVDGKAKKVIGTASLQYIPDASLSKRFVFLLEKGEIPPPPPLSSQQEQRELENNDDDDDTVSKMFSDAGNEVRASVGIDWQDFEDDSSRVTSGGNAQANNGVEPSP